MSVFDERGFNNPPTEKEKYYEALQLYFLIERQIKELLRRDSHPSFHNFHLQNALDNIQSAKQLVKKPTA